MVRDSIEKLEDGRLLAITMLPEKTGYGFILSFGTSKVIDLSYPNKLQKYPRIMKNIPWNKTYSYICSVIIKKNQGGNRSEFIASN